MPDVIGRKSGGFGAFPCDFGGQSNKVTLQTQLLGLMLDNNTVESLLRIPSHSSDSACCMLELEKCIFARSESAPISNDDESGAARPCDSLVRRPISMIQPCSSSEDAPFCKGARSCSDRPARVVERTPARMMSKRAHNFLVGLQLHQESARTKVCNDNLDHEAGLPCRSTGFGRLPSSELWGTLVQ